MQKTNRVFTTLVTLMTSLLIASMVAPQALALKIEVDSRGVAHFYQDVVLGKSDDKGKQEQDGDKQRGGDSKKEYEDREDEKVEYEDKPFKSTSLSNKSLVVEPKKDEVRVEIRDRRNQNEDGEFERVETMNTQRLEMTAPASGSDSQNKAAEAKRETEKEAAEKFNQEKRETQERIEAKNQIMVQNKEEYQAKIQEQRDERKGELLEIKNEFNEGENRQEIKFKSRDVSATVKDGAQLSYDPETNQVSLVTPSGEEKTLSHLPDQALARMQEAGLISGVDVSELEVDTNSLGEIVYKAKVKQSKRFLGLFPREVETEYELEDTSGNLSEIDVDSGSRWQNLLDNFSF